jgi:hypothetical protein
MWWQSPGRTLPGGHDARRHGTSVCPTGPRAQTSAPQTPLLLVGLVLLGMLPACASLQGASPEAGAGVFSNVGAICTVTNPQGTVVQQAVMQVGREEKSMGAPIPTSQGAAREECPLPAGSQVSIVGIGTGTREVLGLGAVHCYGTVRADDLGHCNGGTAGPARLGRHRLGVPTRANDSLSTLRTGVGDVL